jgi:TonB family protein
MRPISIGFFTVILLLLLPSHDGAARASAFESHTIAKPQVASQRKRAKRRTKSKRKSGSSEVIPSAKASDIPPMRRGVTTIIGSSNADSSGYPNPLMLVVTVTEERQVRLNQEDEGTLNDLGALRARLGKIFEERKQSNVLRIGTDEVEKTVIVKSSAYLNEAELSKVVSEVKAAGASPVRVMTEAEFEQEFSPTPPPPVEVSRQSSVRPPIRGGVLNGKAISLPKPAYPAIAKAARASGTVTVQVIIDETGVVISAEVIAGPPLLRASALQAARQARFSPTRLSGQPVKVIGLINYNFVLE